MKNYIKAEFLIINPETGEVVKKESTRIGKPNKKLDPKETNYLR